MITAQHLISSLTAESIPKDNSLHKIANARTYESTMQLVKRLNKMNNLSNSYNDIHIYIHKGVSFGDLSKI